LLEPAVNPRRLKDALADYVPARVLEPAFTWGVTAGYAVKFRGLGAIRANRRLRGVYRGRRCFVLGNGPSLRTHDLGKLRGELVFTVNTFVEHAAELGVRPTCHTLLDPFFFGPDDGGKTLERMAALPPETTCIVPLHYKAVVERYLPNATYILMAGDFAGNANAELSGALPSLYSVTNLALLAAIYMGCSPIYLLGCEMDMLSRVEAVQPLRIRESHYHAENTVADWSTLGYDYSRYAEMVIQMFEGFRFAGRACAPGQHVFNATPGGLLDVFPRADFDGVF
jgi:hypothetical protein